MRIEKIKLYENREDVTLTTYVLEDSHEMLNGKKRPAILVCPGGAYAFCSDREAEPVALKYASMGYHAFVLRYSVYNKGQFINPMEENLPKLDNLHVLEYIKDMDNFLKAADVVITRAGALSVSEICVVGRAAILIPSPNVTGNHQYFNAKAVADKGGAFLIEEKDLKSELVYEKIIEIKNDKDLQKSMEDGAKKAAPGDACQLIFDKVMNTIY